MGPELNGVDIAKLKGIIADNKVTFDEIQGLTKAEQEKLSELMQGRDLPKEGEIVYLKDLKPAVVQAKKPTNPLVGIGGGAVAGAALVAISGFFTGGLSWAALGAGAALGALVGGGATSCSFGSKLEPDIPKQGGTTVHVETNVTLILDDKSKADLWNDIQKLVTALFGEVVSAINVNFAELNQKITDFNNDVNNNGANIKLALTALSTLINSLLKESKDQNATLTAIYGVLKENGMDVKNIISLLKLEGQSLDDILKAVKDNGNKIDEHGNKIETKLDEMISILKDMGYDVKQMLGVLAAAGYDAKDILAEMKKLNINVGDLVNKITENHKDLTKLVTEVLNAVNSGNKLSEENNRILGLILDKIANLPAGEGADVKNIEAILKQMLEQLLKAVKTGEDIKELVIEGNKISQEISNKIDGLGVSLGDAYTEVIAQLKAGNAELMDIRKLVQNIDKTTTSTEAKVAVVAATVNNLYDDFKAYGPEVTMLLTEILAKIPPGCDCHDFDATAIINLLAEIKVIIQTKGGDKNHEGILNDLNDLLG